MTWLSATFEAPSAVLATDAAGERNASLNLDVGGLGRGRFYVNGMVRQQRRRHLCDHSPRFS